MKNFAMGLIGMTAVLFASEVAAQDFAVEAATIASIQARFSNLSCRQMWAKVIKFASFKPEWRRAPHNIAYPRI